jgi:hypothetical protein
MRGPKENQITVRVLIGLQIGFALAIINFHLIGLAIAQKCNLILIYIIMFLNLPSIIVYNSGLGSGFLIFPFHWILIGFCGGLIYHKLNKRRIELSYRLRNDQTATASGQKITPSEDDSATPVAATGHVEGQYDPSDDTMDRIISSKHRVFAGMPLISWGLLMSLPGELLSDPFAWYEGMGYFHIYIVLCLISGIAMILCPSRFHFGLISAATATSLGLLFCLGSAWNPGNDGMGMFWGIVMFPATALLFVAYWFLAVRAFVTIWRLRP